MNKKDDFSQELIKLFLPTEVFEYFEIVNIHVKEKSVEVYLDEINNPPAEYSDKKLTSKGFHSSIAVRDFPIRDKSLFLHIKRRRWLIESSNQVVSRDWNLVAKGTRYTQGFATFLKGLHGQIPNKF